MTDEQANAEADDGEEEPGELSLSTLVDLPEIGLIVNGTWYPYAAHHRWSLRERARFRSLYQQVATLEAMEEPSETDAARFETVRRDLIGLVVPTLPGEQIEALTDAQKGVVIADFLSRSGDQMTKLVPARHLAMMRLMGILQQQPSAGTESSPASSASTAPARRRRG